MRRSPKRQTDSRQGDLFHAVPWSEASWRYIEDWMADTVTVPYRGIDRSLWEAQTLGTFDIGNPQS